MKKLVALAPLTLLLGQTAPPEATHITTNSQAFERSTAEALKKFDSIGFEESLAAPELGSLPAAVIQTAKTKINGAPGPQSATGDVSKKFDVVLQPGHYLRTSGRTGTGGKLVSEQKLAAYVVGMIASRLRRTGYTVLVVPADGVVTGQPAKIFLAVHADGSATPCATGPSLGYDKASTNPYAMHAIGLATSRALGYSYGDFRPDNFTSNEAKYYMFAKMKTDNLSGLLEIGELTCPASEERVVAGADRLGVNVAQALDFILKL